MSSFSFVSPVARSELLNCRRSAQSRSQSASSVAISSVVGFRLAMRSRTLLISTPTVSSWPSKSTNKWALPAGTWVAPESCRAASSVKCSAISNEEGKKPRAKIFCTVAAASDILANEAEIVRREGGNGKSFRIISVVTPSIPSDPTNNPIKSKPVLFLWTRPPVRSTSPLANTISSPTT